MIKKLSLFLSVLILSSVFGYFIFAWTEPGSAPPDGNVPAPLNVGSQAQTKVGNLTVGGEGAGYLYIGNRGYYIGDDLAGSDIQTNAPNLYVYDGDWKRLCREGDGGACGGGSTLPSGMIAMFDTNCPSGWTRLSALDGKFLVGGSSYNTAAGGSNSVTLTISNLPSHTHGSGTLLAASAGSHSHSVDPPSTGTNTAGNHTHSQGTWPSLCDGCGTRAYQDWWPNENPKPINAAGAHTHTVNIGAFNSASAGAHTHSISGSTGAVGSGTAFDNRPAYATIIICKKD